MSPNPTAIQLCAQCREPLRAGRRFCSYRCAALARPWTLDRLANLRKANARRKLPLKPCEYCGKLLKRRGHKATRFCSKQCAQFGLHGELTRETVFQYCTIDPTTGCWNWTRYCDKNGRPTVEHRCRTYYAYRFVYALFKKPTPDGILACHTCDNPRCVNPEHVFPGTHADNTQDAISKGRFRSGNIRKLVPDQVREIRRLREGGAAYEEIAPSFNIHPHTAYAICARKTWQKVV